MLLQVRLPSRMMGEYEHSMSLSVHKGFANHVSHTSLTYRTQQEDRRRRGFHSWCWQQLSATLSPHPKNYHLYTGTESCDLARNNKQMKRTLKVSNAHFLIYLNKKLVFDKYGHVNFHQNQIAHMQKSPHPA